MNVGVGDGTEVDVGLGEAAGDTEDESASGVGMRLAAGAGCDVQALNSTRARTTRRKNDFMRAIIAEALHRVNVTKTRASVPIG